MEVIYKKKELIFNLIYNFKRKLNFIIIKTEKIN